LRQLFHETTGAMFFLLALSWASAALRQWFNKSTPWLWIVCASFAFMFAMFGLTSFRSSRRVR
jgi:ABC-type multidrug transport system permease subunit